MALNQAERTEGMEIKMEVEEEATNSDEVQVDVAGSEEESDKALSNGNLTTPNRGRGRPPKNGSVSKSDKSLSNGNSSTPKRGRPKGSVSKLGASSITPKRGRPKGSVSKLGTSSITPKRGRPKGSVSKLGASSITPKRGRPKGSVSKLGASSITPKRGRPKGSVFKLGASSITPKRGRPKGSVLTQPKMLKVMGKPSRGRPRKPVDPSPNKRGRPSKVESIRGRPRKIVTPEEEEDRKKLESQPRRPLGRPRIYPRNDPPVTEPRGRGRPRKTEDATKPPIYDVPPRKRGRPPGAANKVKRDGEQDKANSDSPVEHSFHTKEKSEEAGFPPVEESDQEDETGNVEYREDPKKPVTPSDHTSFLWASHITPKRGRPKGSVSKLGAISITPKRGRPKGSVSKLGAISITPKRGRPKGSVSKLGASSITPKRGRPKGSVSKLGAISITPKRGRPKGSVSKLGASSITPKRGRPKGSVFFTQPKMLKVMGKPLRGRPRKVVDPSTNKRGRPSKVQLKRGRPKKILTPDEKEELKKLERQPRRPRGRPRIYPCDDPPVTESRGRGRPRKTEDATKPPIYDVPPRKRGRPPGAANKVKRDGEQDKANSDSLVEHSFHTIEKREEAGFPPVEESDQEDETGNVEYREDPKKPVTPSDHTSFLWASHITPKRGRPKGSVSKLGASSITPKRGRPKGSVSKLGDSSITPKRGRPKGSVSKLGAISITPKRGRPKGSVSKLGASSITPKRGRPKGSVFTQPKMLKVMGKPLRGRPRKVVDPSPNKRGRPSIVQSIRGRPRKILTPKQEEDRKLESQPRRPLGRPRIYPHDDRPVTEPRGRGRPRKTEDATKPPIYDVPPRKRGRPPGAANKVKRDGEQDKANSEPPVKHSFHSIEKSEEAGFPPVEESDQEDETGNVDEESETGKNIQKSPRSQFPPVTAIALLVP